MQKGQLPGQPGQEQAERVAESAAPRSRGGRLRKAERYIQIGVVIPPELKRKFFAMVPCGSRSAFIASLLRERLDAMEESAAACQALEAKVTPVTPQG